MEVIVGGRLTAIRRRMAMGLMAQAVATYHDLSVAEVLDDLSRFVGVERAEDIHGDMVKAAIDYLSG